MMNQQPAPMPTPRTFPAQTALIIAAFPAVMGVLGFGADVVSFGIGFSSLSYSFFSTLMAPVVFAAAAFVSLAFIRTPNLNGPIARLASPILIAGAIGGALQIGYRYIVSAVRTFFDDGVTHSTNLGAALAGAILLTILLGFGAVYLRARRWGRELEAGAPARHEQAVSVLIIAGIILVEPIVMTILSSAFLAGHGPMLLLSTVGLAILRGVLFALATFIVLMLIRPFAAIRTVAQALVSVAIAGAIGLGLLLLLAVISTIVEGQLDHFFPFTLLSTVWVALECTSLVALSVLVVLAVRGQRVLTGRMPPRQERQAPAQPFQQQSQQQPPIAQPPIAQQDPQ